MSKAGERLIAAAKQAREALHKAGARPPEHPAALAERQRIVEALRQEADRYDSELGLLKSGSPALFFSKGRVKALRTVIARLEAAGTTSEGE